MHFFPSYKEPKKKTENGDSDNEEFADAKNNEFLDSDGEVNYDALRQVKKKKMEALPDLDHKKIDYDSFNKNFYNEHEEIQNLSVEKVNQIRKDMEIKIKGSMVPKPIVAFGHLNIDESIIAKFAKMGYEKPTPIQAQSLPCVLSGRDLIGIAKTGSGKTLAYVMPLIIHILDQPELRKKEGPIGVILCPTRELSQQVYLEAKKYARIYHITVAALLGGENKHDQWKELRAGVEILVATPGRLIDMYRKKALNFQRVTYVVLDEADKMFGMGFEWQIRQILSQSRPDRQTMLFSATFNKKVKSLCWDYLEDPIHIVIGQENVGNTDVKQEIMTFDDEGEKYIWLEFTLANLVKTGKVLVFVNTIADCNEMQRTLVENCQLNIGVIHGDKLQYERTTILNNFKRPEGQVLIATDVASRGLDIPEIKWVINYENPRDIETHVHRIGRTGRAGAQDGVAITLLLRNETKFAALLSKNLDQSGQTVPPDIEDMALNEGWYKEWQFKKKMGIPKGKDSSRLLKQALAKGQKGTTGLGYQNSDDDDYFKKRHRPKETHKKRRSRSRSRDRKKMDDSDDYSSSLSFDHRKHKKSGKSEKIKEKERLKSSMDYNEKVIRDGGIPLESLNNKYREMVSQIRAEEHQIQSTMRMVPRDRQEKYLVKKKSRFTNEHGEGRESQKVVNEAEYRKECLNEFASTMKNKLRDQFRSQFVSKGNLL